MLTTAEQAKKSLPDLRIVRAIGRIRVLNKNPNAQTRINEELIRQLDEAVRRSSTETERNNNIWQGLFGKPPVQRVKAAGVCDILGEAGVVGPRDSQPQEPRAAPGLHTQG